jgi:hypothetical protein
MAEPQQVTVLVAGDICIDVVGIPVPGASSAPAETDNWRLTGEIRTHYLPGGAFQVAEFVRAAAPDADVRAPIPCRPKELSCAAAPDQAMPMDEFLGAAERLTRNEIVHSLLRLGLFKGTPDSKKADTIRVSEPQGFSGPKDSDPSLKTLPPDGPDGNARMVVLDDTGNLFRRSPDQWPAVVARPPTANPPVLLYKLHRPLPAGKGTNKLWDAVMANHAERCLVIVSVDDLRDRDAAISRGLSWERTALDVVWQLLHAAAFAPLRDCPHLVVRLGLDGALYWHCRKDKNGQPQHYAWLVYDPAGIEGTGVCSFPGRMVGYASVFAAALVAQLVAHSPADDFRMAMDAEGNLPAPPQAIEDGIKAGLTAARRLLALGFGKAGKSPGYPKTELFAAGADAPTFFACRPVPIIPGAGVPDRGYWRLLESIFSGKTALLHRAVAMAATGAKPANAEDKTAYALLQQAPVAIFAKALRAIDRREIENYRALYSLLHDYIALPAAPRPLSVAVFGPPGAGKSFGVKMVAKALGDLGGKRPIDPITFNLSQYQKADDLADAFHLVRDRVLGGKIPLVFFDEFDTSLDGKALGWLRYFLAPMQDGEFLDRGTPHPVGQAIFVFAGGTCGSYAEFARPFIAEASSPEGRLEREAFQKAKGPDFLSRLRATLDIPGLDLQTEFDPFGPVEAFPSESAILLRRANIFAFQLGEKAPHLRDSSGALRVSDSVLRVLLHLPKFVHGNRSFEAMLDMSHFQGADKFTPALLPASGHTALHANANHLVQLLAANYPFPPPERELIARKIHELYVLQRKQDPKHDPKDPALRDWDELGKDELGRSLQKSNFEQADDIAVKLRAAGLWFRKVLPGVPADPKVNERLQSMVETLAHSEHDRWVVEKRKDGWIAAASTARASRNNHYRLHNALVPWEELPEELKELDLGPVRNIPVFLAAAGYEIF